MSICGDKAYKLLESTPLLVSWAHRRARLPAAESLEDWRPAKMLEFFKSVMLWLLAINRFGKAIK